MSEAKAMRSPDRARSTMSGSGSRTSPLRARWDSGKTNPARLHHALQDGGGRRMVRRRTVSSPMDPREEEKRAAAQEAALALEDGMTLGLGTGSTVAIFLPALAARSLSITCV